MGVPMKNGGHILFPEEAVYLIEHRNAYATDGGRLLTLYDGYRILQECSVSMHKFRAYSALRQGGFVVLRPNVWPLLFRSPTRCQVQLMQQTLLLRIFLHSL
uniref:tRNA_int_end_N2 domain-containing protein n=1 Tax=Angiostrongylus cantonensis TaxID=6313 RepID=A0A0K0DIL5_ANGCA